MEQKSGPRIIAVGRGLVENSAGKHASAQDRRYIAQQQEKIEPSIISVEDSQTLAVTIGGIVVVVL